MEHKTPQQTVSPQFLGNFASKFFAWLSVATYLGCFAFPAYFTSGKYPTSGLVPLFLGPAGILDGHFAWAANPFLWWSLRSLFLGRKDAALWCAVVAFLLATSFLLYKDMPSFGAGNTQFKVGIGYYVWISSIIFAMIGALAYRQRTSSALESLTTG